MTDKKDRGTIVVPNFVVPEPHSVYVGGPMRGFPRFNFDAFNAASERLRSKGWLVYSPAEHDVAIGFDPDTGLEDQEYSLAGAFRWDVATIAVREAIYLLEHWEGSTGANIEHDVANMCGLAILFETDDLYPDPESIFKAAA